MILEVSNLTKYYGDFQALNNFNLSVKKGEILGLLGPNGSGKTTTISCILSLLNYSDGEIKIFGKTMNPDAYDIKKDIGFVMQNVAVFEELTVYQNINYFCGLYIKEKSKREKLVEEAINFVKLTEFKKKYPSQLSGGLLRRLNIACGIAHKPKLIILDEPTVAVDPQSRNYILENIVELKKQGATVIYTTHYMEEVEQICDRIVIMDHGKEIANGTKEELKSHIGVEEKVCFDAVLISNDLVEDMKNISDVEDAMYEDNLLVLSVKKDSEAILNILQFLKNNNISYERMYTKSPTLNDVFLDITGRELRE